MHPDKYLITPALKSWGFLFQFDF